MNKLYLLLILLAFIGCDSGKSPLNAPADIANISAKADTGGVTVSWDMPPDTSYLYINVSYRKYPNKPESDSNKVITTQASKFSNSVHIDGLLHKYKYKFRVQSFTADNDAKKGGKALTTEEVQPIRRPVKTTYYPNSLTQITGITADMMDMYTVYNPGTLSNLLDGDLSTQWQTAWHGSTYAPLPHWLQTNFENDVTMGAFKYYLRQSSDDRPRPTQFALEISEDGSSWTRVWTSKPDLPTTPIDKQKSLYFDKNYTAKHFRIMFLANVGDVSFVQLSEIRFYKMKVEQVDKEEEAEQSY